MAANLLQLQAILWEVLPGRKWVLDGSCRDFRNSTTQNRNFQVSGSLC